MISYTSSPCHGPLLSYVYTRFHNVAAPWWGWLPLSWLQTPHNMRWSARLYEKWLVWCCPCKEWNFDNVRLRLEEITTELHAPRPPACQLAAKCPSKLTQNTSDQYMAFSLSFTCKWQWVLLSYKACNRGAKLCYEGDLCQARSQDFSKGVYMDV